jgi:hypothetical protein
MEWYDSNNKQITIIKDIFYIKIKIIEEYYLEREIKILKEYNSFREVIKRCEKIVVRIKKIKFYDEL